VSDPVAQNKAKLSLQLKDLVELIREEVPLIMEEISLIRSEKD
jgi:hypothetical protein